MTYTHYYRLHISTSTLDVVKFEKEKTELQALKLINDWNRVSVIPENKPLFHYWV